MRLNQRVALGIGAAALIFGVVGASVVIPATIAPTQTLASAEAHVPDKGIDCPGWFVDLTYYDSGATISLQIDGNVLETNTVFGGTYHNSGSFAVPSSVEHLMVLDVNSNEGADNVPGDGDVHDQYDVHYTYKTTNCITISPTAEADYTTTDGGCYGVVGTVSFTQNHSTWLTPADNTVGTHTRTAQADLGFTFPGGGATKDVTYTIQPAIANNVPPCVTVHTVNVVKSVAVCSGAPTWTIGANNIDLPAIPGYQWTASADLDGNGTIDPSEISSLPVGTGYNGPPLAGYHDYTISGTDVDPSDGDSTPNYTTTWTPIDPSTITCNPPTVGGVCTTTSSDTSTPASPNGWATDDGDPTYTVDGLLFDTPTNTAHQNLYHIVIEKLADLKELGFTIASAPSGPEASIQIRLFADGVNSSTFVTLYGEAYLNGGSLTSTGHFEVITWKFTSSRPLRTGGLAFGTLDQFLALIPDAGIIGYGPNQGSNNAGGKSTVSDVSLDCHTTTFGFDVIATPPAPVVLDPTCLADGSLPTLGANGVYDRTFNGPGNYIATFTAPPGSAYAGNLLTVSYPLMVLPKLPASDPACQTVVTAVDPTSTGSTCTAGAQTDATYVIPTTVGVAYFKNGSVTAIAAGSYKASAGETVVITSQPVNNTYRLTNASWSWTLTVPSLICVGQLAMTGTSIIITLSIGAMLMLGGFWLYSRRKTGKSVA